MEDAENETAEPSLLMCIMGVDGDGKKTLSLPPTSRAKWLDDPVRKDRWQAELSNFDARQALLLLYYVLLAPQGLNHTNKTCRAKRRKHLRLNKPDNSIITVPPFCCFSAYSPLMSL